MYFQRKLLLPACYLTTALFCGTSAVASAALSDRIRWIGDESNQWQNPLNWHGGNLPRAGQTAVFASLDDAPEQRQVIFSQSERIGGLEIDSPRFTLVAAQTRTLTLEAVTVTNAFSADSNVFDGGRSPRLQISFDRILRLNNRSRHSAGFGAARLIGSGELLLEGQGGWHFGSSSSMYGAQGAMPFNIQLTPDFSGILSYASRIPLQADSMEIHSGALKLRSNGKLQIASPVEVHPSGAAGGTGEILGDLHIRGGVLFAGEISSPGQLALNGNLILHNASGTHTLMRITPGRSDVLQATGRQASIQFGGILVIELIADPGARTGWTLFSDFAHTDGSFEGVVLLYPRPASEKLSVEHSEGRVTALGQRIKQARHYSMAEEQSPTTVALHLKRQGNIWTAIDTQGNQWSFDEQRGVISLKHR